MLMATESKATSESRRLEMALHAAGSRKTERYKQSWAWQALRASSLGELARGMRSLSRELWAWQRCQSVILPDVKHLTRSLAVLHPQASDQVGGASETEAPIFLLSTGWRAGSTLLQRILITEPRLLLWGEPLGEMTIVSKIAEMISHSLSPRNLQLWRDQPDPSSPGLPTSWVANLYPQSDDFHLALRGLFDRWLHEPARERGFARWGLKEVRFGAVEAALLHWLYPNARFVIITRHPYDSYRSLADAAWDPVYYRYPDVCVDSAASFARHWNRLAVSWSELPAGFPSFHIKYEDLVAGKVDFRKLESWLGIEIKESVALSASVGGTAKRRRLSWYERLIIAREAAEGLDALGYPR
jgi:hypothetical protein